MIFITYCLWKGLRLLKLFILWLQCLFWKKQNKTDILNYVPDFQFKWFVCMFTFLKDIFNASGIEDICPTFCEIFNNAWNYFCCKLILFLILVLFAGYHYEWLSNWLPLWLCYFIITRFVVLWRLCVISQRRGMFSIFSTNIILWTLFKVIVCISPPLLIGDIFREYDRKPQIIYQISKWRCTTFLVIFYNRVIAYQLA